MKTAQEYQKRLQRHLDELKWLYCELYPGREDMFGMMLYIDAFAGNLKGVKKKLSYLEACNVNYLHLMPFLCCLNHQMNLWWLLLLADRLFFPDGLAFHNRH